MQVNILEAKNRLSSLIVAAEQDQEVIIARNGQPVAKIVKYSARVAAISFSVIAVISCQRLFRKRG